MARLTKTLEYRRARFLDDGQNLEQLVRQAWGQYGTQAERTVTSSDERSTCGLRSRNRIGGGIAVHCARYTDGQGVGTIPTIPAPEVEVAERAPEPGENFLNSDFMAFIRDNHVICMNCGRSAGSLRIYLQQLFRKARFPDAAGQFEIVRIGNPKKLAMIEEFGVKSIDMEVEISEATAAVIVDGAGRGSFWRSIKNNIGSTFTAITARDESVGNLRRAEKGSVKVSINVPQSDLSAAKDGLNDFSAEVLEDEESDDFVIHLRGGGGTIKPNEVSVRKQVKLEAMANSVSVFQAWDAMETYMDELEENGQLEA